MRIAAFLSLVLLSLAAIGYYNASESVSKVDNGFVICRSDCTDYNNFSDYLIQNGRFIPQSQDLHSGVFFRGFIFWVATMKFVFGPFWKPAFVAFNVLFTWLLVLLGTRLLAPREAWRFFVPISVLLMVGHKGFLEQQKTLLTDYLFAILNAGAFLLIASGVANSDRKKLAWAAGLSFLFLFVRSNGAFALATALGFLAMSYVRPLFRDARWKATVPLIAGLCAVVIATLLTLRGAERLHQGAPLSSLDAGTQIFVRTNYIGEELGVDGVTLESRLGTGVVNDPYFSWIYNDGSFLGVMGGIFQKIPYFFEVTFPNYSAKANLYRVFYYGFLYGLTLLFAAWSFREWRKDPTGLYLIAMTMGYSMFTCAITFVTVRYRLVFDVLFILMGAQVLSRLLIRSRAF